MSVIVQGLKRESSKWLKTKAADLADFYWQNGYGAFSIGQSGVETLTKYIANQKEHHRKKTFQEEFRTFRKSLALNDRIVKLGLDWGFDGSGPHSYEHGSARISAISEIRPSVVRIVTRGNYSTPSLVFFLRVIIIGPRYDPLGHDPIGSFTRL